MKKYLMVLFLMLSGFLNATQLLPVVDYSCNASPTPTCVPISTPGFYGLPVFPTGTWIVNVIVNGGTATNTPTGTLTPTPTPTPGAVIVQITGTVVVNVGNQFTQVPQFTQLPAVAAAQTGTWVVGAQITWPTATFTNTPTNTFTNTFTATPTYTGSNTPTNTPTGTWTGVQFVKSPIVQANVQDSAGNTISSTANALWVVQQGAISLANGTGVSITGGNVGVSSGITVVNVDNPVTVVLPPTSTPTNTFTNTATATPTFTGSATPTFTPTGTWTGVQFVKSPIIQANVQDSAGNTISSTANALWVDQQNGVTVLVQPTPNLTQVSSASLQLTQVAVAQTQVAVLNLALTPWPTQGVNVDNPVTIGGQPVSVYSVATPTNTYTPTYGTGTNTPTNTPTFTPWVPLVANATEAAATPTYINTPITGKATSLIIDSIFNNNTSSALYSIWENGVVISKGFLSPYAIGVTLINPCSTVPVMYTDISGGVSYGFSIGGSNSMTVNYRLWVAPIGTPPPGPLR